MGFVESGHRPRWIVDTVVRGRRPSQVGAWVLLSEAAGQVMWDMVMVERGRRPSQVGLGYGETRPQTGLDKAWVWWSLVTGQDGLWIRVSEAAGRAEWDMVMVERGGRPSRIRRG